MFCGTLADPREPRKVRENILYFLTVSVVGHVQATSQLVNALKSEAESQSDSEQQKKLLAAAKLLADATARMVEAAKVKYT